MLRPCVSFQEFGHRSLFVGGISRKQGPVTVPCNIAVTFKAVALRDRFPYKASTTRSLSKTTRDEMSMVCSPCLFITAGSLMYLYVKDSKYYQGIHANMNITPHRYRQSLPPHDAGVSHSVKCVSICKRRVATAARRKRSFKIRRSCTRIIPAAFLSFVSTSSGDTYRKYTCHQTIKVLPILHSNYSNRMDLAKSISRAPAQTGTPQAKTSLGESLAVHPSSVALPISSLKTGDVPLDLTSVPPACRGFGSRGYQRGVDGERIYVKCMNSRQS